jgi:hypothetical protein
MENQRDASTRKPYPSRDALAEDVGRCGEDGVTLDLSLLDLTDDRQQPVNIPNQNLSDSLAATITPTKSRR